MTPEQLKLLQKLSQLGKVNLINRSKKNTYSRNAITELKSTKILEITKEEIVSWLDKHKEFYESLAWMSFNYKNLSKFYDSYNHISKINDFFELEETCFNAFKVYVKNDMTIEMQLLKWLVEHEELHCKLMLLYPNVIDGKDHKSGKINLFKDLNRYFNSEYLKYCISVENVFDTYYYEKLNHYRIEDEKLKDISPFDDNFDEYISLGFHLEKRNLFVDKINFIPLLGKNTFLHDAPDITMMKKGVNFDTQNFRSNNSIKNKNNDDYEVI